MKIPNENNRKWIQTNRSSIFGNLKNSMCLDLESDLGMLKVSPRMILNTNGLDGLPWGFRFFDTKIWAGAGAKIYGGGAEPFTGFSEDASTGAQTDFSADESDLEVFNGTMCGTTTDALVSKASNGSGAGAWTARGTALNTGGQHILSYFKKFDRLYYTDLSCRIRSITTGWAESLPGTDYAITLSADSAAYTITCMKFNSECAWIGILDKSKEGQVGKILQWDAISSQITREFKLNSQGCLALIIDPNEDIPFAIDTNLCLLKYSFNGFRVVGKLPVSDKLLQIINDLDNGDRPVHPNGLLITKEGNIRVLVNNINSDGTFNEDFQAGVYEFRPIGDGTYSCHHVSSPADTTSYAQTRFSKVGALASVNTYSNSATRNGTFMVGVNYYTDATPTVSSGIFYDDSNDLLVKAGYLTTTKFFAGNIEERWQEFIVKLGRRLLDSGDRIVVKYRTTESDVSADFTITWSATSTIFTTTKTGLAVGQEIEVTAGDSAGLLAHISDISAPAGGIYTVTLDENLLTTTNGHTAKARMQSWTKVGSFSLQTEDYAKWPLGFPSVWLQIRVFFVFKGKDVVYEFLINKTQEK